MAAFEVLALDTATPQIRAPGAADTYTFPRAITPSGANVTPFTVSGYSLTGANAQSLIDLSGTWNTTGTPTGIKLNVTDTASNAASLLMDLQRGGVTQLSVNKFGTIFSRTNGATDVLTTSAGTRLNDYASYFSFNNTVASTVGFSFITSVGVAADLLIVRDAANTLAQRNGVNAQTLRVYNTFTDASNYERGFARWGVNVFQVGAEAAGTGTARDFEIVTGGATRLTITASGSAFFAGGIFGGGEVRAASASPIHWNNRSKLTSPADGVIKATNAATTAGSAVELDEMTAPAAPAANSVRIYAVDNGSGKTQLMALFATGAAQQIAIEP